MKIPEDAVFAKEAENQNVEKQLDPKFDPKREDFSFVDELYDRLGKAVLQGEQPLKNFLEQLETKVVFHFCDNYSIFLAISQLIPLLFLHHYNCMTVSDIL